MHYEPGTDAAYQHHVAGLFDELQPEQVHHLLSIDLFGPGPVEPIEGLFDGEAGEADAPGDGAVAAPGGLALDETGEQGQVVPLLFGGGSGRSRRSVRARTPVGRCRGRRGRRRGRLWVVVSWCVLRVEVAVVVAEVGVGEVQFQGIAGPGEVQGAGFGGQPVAAFQKVFDVFAAQRAEVQGVGQGTGGGFLAVDLAQGDDLADVVAGVEAALLEFRVVRLGARRQRQEALQQPLAAGAHALGQQGLGMIRVLEVPVPVVAARMPGDEPVLAVDADPVGIGFQRQALGGVLGGHRVAVGLEGDAEAVRGAHRMHVAEVVGPLRQRLQPLPFLLEPVDGDGGASRRVCARWRRYRAIPGRSD